MLRPHHLRALAILVTLVSLSLLFSTFSMRSGESRTWMMDRLQHTGREVMSAADVHQQLVGRTEETAASFPLTTTPAAASRKLYGVGEVYQITRKSLKPGVVKVTALFLRRPAVDSIFSFNSLARSQKPNEIARIYFAGPVGPTQNQKFVPQSNGYARRYQVSKYTYLTSQ